MGIWMMEKWMSRNQMMIWRKTISWEWMLNTINQKYTKVRAETND